MHGLDLGLYSHLRELAGGRGGGDGVRTHVNSKGKVPSTGKKIPRGGSHPRRCIKQDSEPNALPTSYSGPLDDDITPGEWELFLVCSTTARRMKHWDRRAESLFLISENQAIDPVGVSVGQLLCYCWGILMTGPTVTVIHEQFFKYDFDLKYGLASRITSS